MREYTKAYRSTWPCESGYPGRIWHGRYNLVHSMDSPKSE